MKISILILASLFMACCAEGKGRSKKGAPLHSATPTAPLERLKARVEGIIKKGIDAGVVVASIDSGEILYEHDADEPLIPASTNKLFTAFTAMKKLRPTFQFKTSVYVTGAVREGKLAGDLYIKGGGDPSLVSERLWMLVNELIRSGIRTVTGNLVVDSSYFDTEKVPESRPKYLKDQAYNSPVGAFSFNFNTCTVYVKPGESVGSPPVVYTDPENAYIDVVNQATTGKSGSNNSVVASRTEFVKGDIGDTVLLRGSIPINHKEMRFYKNIVNPALYSGAMFKTFWEQRGAKFMGSVKEGEVPGGARKILDFESQPLWQIVWGMNKFSNNFVADMLVKDVGAEMFGQPGTLAKGISAVEETLEDIGIPKKSYKIVDGSGLTRNTHVTPKQMLTLLVAAYRDFSMGPEFLASLGIAGEDGTLRRRFSNGDLTGLLRAKTGTLDGVSSLAGYAPTADGEMVAFVIILNDPRGKYGRMTAWVDEIALAIGKFSRKS